MPEINLIEVKSCTSQDAKHVAENLLTTKKRTGKWLIEKPRKCSQMEATFQLAQMCTISSVHIGNFGSAFITLLVSRSGSGNFETLLPCSELRPMQDSKMGSKKESVQMYFSGNFMENTRNGKWDQLRVVVMQPFNREEQFGLSFLSVYSFNENKNDTDVITDAELQKWDKLKNSVSLSKSPSMSRGCKLLQEARQRKSEHEAKPVVTANNDDTSIPDKNEEEEAVFKLKVFSFMDSLNLRVSDLGHLRLKELEQGFAKALEKPLDVQEKPWFISIVRSYLKKIWQSKEEANEVKSNLGGREKSKTNFSLGTKALDTQSQSPDSAKSRIYNLENSLASRTVDKESMEKPSTSKDLQRDIVSNRRNKVSLEDSLVEERTEKPLASDIIVISDESEDIFPATSFERKQGLKRKLLEDNDDNAEAHESKRNCAVNDFVECPICNVLFETSLIESHCAQCNSFRDEDIPEVPCPLCGKMISAAVLDVHAVRCAYIMFGD